MKTHTDFFSFRKLEKFNNHSLTSNKYSQLPTFISKKPFFQQNILNNSKSKEKTNKRYFLNSNRIPNIKQKNIKSFSLSKKAIKLDNLFNLSNSNFSNVGSFLKSKNINASKSLNLKSNIINDNHMKYASKTMPKNNTIYKMRTTNKVPFSKPKPNLKKIKLMNDINVLNSHDNLNNHLTSLKLEMHKTNNIKNKSNKKTIQDFTIQNLLNEKYLTYSEAKHSSNRFDVISAYGVNTYKGIIRNYNEDRVSIIVNAKKPKKFISNQNNIWPNISFFGIFDGHAGNKCAEYLKNNLHNYIFDSPHFPSSPIKAIHNGFQQCEKDFINLIYSKPFNQYLDYSGSCAIVVLLINNQCYIANLGDSRAIYSYNGGSEFYQLSRDHKPNDPNEKKRIYKAGGSIFKTELDQYGMPYSMKESDLGFKIPFRINPGRLAVSKYLII